MAEAPQDSRKSAEEALQASKDILKTEGDINGQLKERVKNLQKVIKAHDDIIGKIKASEELGKDLKELDLDIYKNLRQRVQMDNALGRIQMEGQQRGIDLLAIVQEKRESIKASQLQEGPFKIKGHLHRVLLCSDVVNECCDYCEEIIEPIHTMYFGYRCGKGCPLTICVGCLGKNRTYKSKQMIQYSALL